MLRLASGTGHYFYFVSFLSPGAVLVSYEGGLHDRKARDRSDEGTQS